VTVLYLVAAVLALLSGLRAALRLHRLRSEVVAAVLCMVTSGAALLAAAFTPSFPEGGPSPSLLSWAAPALGLFAAWAFLEMQTRVAGEKVRPVVNVAIPATGVGLAYLAQAALEAARHTAVGADLPAALPAAAASLVLMSFHCPALGRITALAWRCSRRIPVRYIDMGMRTVAVGAAAEFALILVTAAEVSTAVCGVSAFAPVVNVVAVAQGVAVIQVIAGATVPAWFPAVMWAPRDCRAWAAWCRLRPLWALLVAAAPGVQLSAQPGTRLNARYRLHRRVIEIRDAELALRPFWDSQAAREAVDAVLSAGLPVDEHDALIEAVMVMTALDARQAGAPACGGHDGARFLSDPRNDLESEAARLLLVARAVRRSPIVRRATVARSRPATAR
jgi:hypothetical protein